MGCSVLMSWCVIAAKRARSTDSIVRQRRRNTRAAETAEREAAQDEPTTELRDHAGTVRMLRERGPFCAALGHSSQCCYHPRRSLGKRSVQRVRRLAPDRRRRMSRPETLRHSNGRSFARRVGRATASSGEWWTSFRIPSTEGVRRRAPDLSGHRTEGRQARGYVPAALVRVRVRAEPEDLWDDTHRSTNCIEAKARASSISAAGTCPCSTHRKSRSTTRCAARRVCLTSRTWALLI